MEKITREEVRTVNVFIAHDGTEFTNENACLEHEAKIECKKVYAIARKSRTSTVKEMSDIVFSNRTNAEKYLSHMKLPIEMNPYIIVEVYLDIHIKRIEKGIFGL